MKELSVEEQRYKAVMAVSPALKVYMLVFSK